MPTEPLADKFSTFGWRVFEADGHDIASLLKAIGQAGKTAGRPSVIIARTVKGFGVSFMENRFEWHSGSIIEEQYDKARADLEEKG